MPRRVDRRSATRPRPQPPARGAKRRRNRRMARVTELVRAASLPLVANSFAGRQREPDELAGLVDEAVVVSLVGPGGVGKTRLAVEFAQRAADEFPDVVRFVDFSPNRAPELVVGEIGLAVGVTPGPGGAVQLPVEQATLACDSLHDLDAGA